MGYNLSDHVNGVSVMIFLDSSSSHDENCKNNFAVLVERQTDSINGRVSGTEQKFSITFSNEKTKVGLCFHYSYDNSYLFVNGTKIFKFKRDYKNINFPTQFCLGNISDKFDAVIYTDVLSKGNAHHFSVHYNAIYKSDILNIHNYLIVKNNIK